MWRNLPAWLFGRIADLLYRIDIYRMYRVWRGINIYRAMEVAASGDGKVFHRPIDLFPSPDATAPHRPMEVARSHVPEDFYRAAQTMPARFIQPRNPRNPANMGLETQIFVAPLLTFTVIFAILYLSLIEELYPYNQEV